MDIKQDPNAIPDFGHSGRLGESHATEPEEVQSSVELDPPADRDTRDIPVGSGRDAPLDNGSGATAHVTAPSRAGEGSATGAGRVDER